MTSPHFKRPGWFTKNVFNRFVAFLTRRGLSVAGSRVLEVRGRKSGEPRRTPVNPLTIDGDRYLVAPRGNTQWVRNLRAGEVPDAEKPPILRAYLRKWKWEVGAFFDGVDADSPEEEVRRIAPAHPIFRISPR